jgi:hypothetical protein
MTGNLPAQSFAQNARIKIKEPWFFKQKLKAQLEETPGAETGDHLAREQPSQTSKMESSRAESYGKNKNQTRLDSHRTNKEKSPLGDVLATDVLGQLGLTVKRRTAELRNPKPELNPRESKLVAVARPLA